MARDRFRNEGVLFGNDLTGRSPRKPSRTNRHHILTLNLITKKIRTFENLKVNKYAIMCQRRPINFDIALFMYHILAHNSFLNIIVDCQLRAVAPKSIRMENIYEMTLYPFFANLLDIHKTKYLNYTTN